MYTALSIFALIALSIIFYKQLFWFFGIYIIPDDKIGLVSKKFAILNKSHLPNGKIIALNGEAGYQADTLAPGLHLFYWPWQYDIIIENMLEVPPMMVATLSARDGLIPPQDTILNINPSGDFQDAKMFLLSGGFRGKQASVLLSGKYRINTFLFEYELHNCISISNDEIGLVTTNAGGQLDKDEIAGPVVNNHQKFQNFESFLLNGGKKGKQEELLLEGIYNLNPWAVSVEKINFTEIPIGSVGVVNSFIGKTTNNPINFPYGNIVNINEKGIWNVAYGSGKYSINTFTQDVLLVPISNIVLKWSEKSTSVYDKYLKPVKVRSKDGFDYDIEVSQIIHIPKEDAPKVIARFGSIDNLILEIMEPIILNYFRNSAQKSDIIDFLMSRQERQNEAKDAITKALKEYGIVSVDTLIGDIKTPEIIAKTLSDRKIAMEKIKTINAEMQAEEMRSNYEKQKAIADIQKDVVESEQLININTNNAKSVIINAEAEASKIKAIGFAESETILAKGKSVAEGYKLQSDAMGSDNFGKFKITESISENGIKIVPDVLINSNGNSTATDLLSLSTALNIKDINKK